MSNTAAEPTAAALRAAKKMTSPGAPRSIVLDYAFTIDRATKLPELIAERDRLAKRKGELQDIISKTARETLFLRDALVDLLLVIRTDRLIPDSVSYMKAADAALAAASIKPEGT